MVILLLYFFSPLGGFITTMLSRKYYYPNPKPSKIKKNWGRFLIILCIMSFFGQCSRLSREPIYAGKIDTFFLSIGFIGLGLYLLELGKGKNFNSHALTKKDL